MYSLNEAQKDEESSSSSSSSDDDNFEEVEVNEKKEIQIIPNKFRLFNASCLAIYGLSIILVSPFILDVSGFYSKAPEDHYPRITGIFMHIV